jgi:hypothetical protein
MTTKLHALIAVEKGVRAKADRALTDAYHNIQKDQPLTGLARTYQPSDAEGETQPDEKVLVQVSVPDLIRNVEKRLVRMFDVVASKERTNQTATADIVLPDGTVLVESVPATYLLFLERQLVDLRTFASKLPILDPAEEWTFDPNTNTYVTEPKKSNRTRKALKNHVKWAPPTPEYKQEAQVETFSTEEKIGEYTARQFSGKIPAKEKAALIDRIDALTDAVKVAKETANSTEVVDLAVGEPLLRYLFDGV